LIANFSVLQVFAPGAVKDENEQEDDDLCYSKRVEGKSNFVPARGVTATAYFFESKLHIDFM